METRSRKQERISRENGDTGKANGVLSNGFHGYKEGYEKLEEIGVTDAYRRFFDRVVSPILIMLITPNMSIIMWYTCAKCGGSYVKMLELFSRKSLILGLVEIWSSVRFIDFLPMYILIGFSIWSLLLMKILPGKIVKGPITPKGNVPEYVDNGFKHFVVTAIAFVFLTCALKSYGLTPTIVYDRLDEFIVSLNCFSLVFCVFLYLKGLYAPSSSDNGSSGNIVFDYYWGTELYPRVFGFDIKVFTNCRFGLMVWALLVMIYALKSYEMYGFVDSTFVSAFLQLAYLAKFYWWEAGYMSTIDIMVDRAGYYICWGCLVWVPSFYAGVSMYLVEHPVQLGPFWSSIILAAGLFSIAINYLADWQKQRVRSSNGDCLIWGKKPDIIHATYSLENGQKKESILLASGWWGLSRHFHYIPEIMLSFCWSVPALFEHGLPYSYVIYLTVLLVHRSFRDEMKCSAKYNKYWVEYCEKVPSRIVPYVF